MAEERLTETLYLPLNVSATLTEETGHSSAQLHLAAKRRQLLVHEDQARFVCVCVFKQHVLQTAVLVKMGTQYQRKVKVAE